MPSAAPTELASAILDVVRAGARVVNLSLALLQSSTRGEWELQQALDLTARKAVIVVAAAGNQGTVGGTTITRHPWVIPVVACDSQGRPMALSNLGSSIGRRGVGGPGERVTSLRASGGAMIMSGTSVAAPFVTGAVALLWSRFPDANAAEIKLAVSGAWLRRDTIAPPLLNVQAAYEALAQRGHSISL